MLDIDTKIEQLLEQQQILQHKLEEQKQQNRSQVKLPELEIPTFDGDKLKWTEFWDFFQVTVDQNNHLSNIEKFIYLKNSLTGDAKHAVAGILMSNNNYQNAKTLLKERFEDTELVKHTHFRELINLLPASNNPKDLRAVYDKLEIHLRSLESQQQDTNHAIFISIISSKIPKDVLQQLALQKGMNEKWTANTLRKSFKNYICATEWAEQMSCSEMPEKDKQTYANGLYDYHRSIVQCKFCNGNHWSDQCMEYPTAEDRKQKIKDSCFLCLKRGHIAHKCRLNKLCCYCKCINHHNRSLCPQRFVSKTFYEATKPIIDEPLTCQRIKRENSLRGSDLAQEQNQVADIQKETLSRFKNACVNEKELTGKMTQGYEDQINENSNMVSEDSCERKQEELESVYSELAKEKAELQAMNKELNMRLLDETEKRSKLQLENKDLVTQLRDIANSMTNTPKVSEEAIWSGEATSVCNFESVKVQTDKSEMEKKELTKEEHQLIRSKPGEGTEFDKSTENMVDFTTNKHERFSVFVKGNIHQHWHMDKLPWPWECRGNPTILI